jgi:hypothetical protein
MTISVPRAIGAAHAVTWTAHAVTCAAHAVTCAAHAVTCAAHAVTCAAHAGRGRAKNVMFLRDGTAISRLVAEYSPQVASAAKSRPALLDAEGGEKCQSAQCPSAK